MGLKERAESLVSTAYEDNTPTPSTVRQKVSLLDDVMEDFRYEDFSRALQRKEEPLVWPDFDASAKLGLKSSGSNRPCGADDSTDGFDGSILFAQDLDLYSGGELLEDNHQRQKDEKLLAMLGDMARGASEDDDLSEVLGMLPMEVQEEDPAIAQSVADCAQMWEEVYTEAEVKHELQSRLQRELRQLQERGDRQYQESSVFMQRLATAKEALAEKLQESSFVNQDLRVRLDNEWRNNERLRCSISEVLKSLNARSAELNARIWEVSDDQASLIEEFHIASELQAQLQTELQEERVLTWRQSTDVVMAFARGNHSATPSKASGRDADREARRSAELEAELRREEELRDHFESELRRVSDRVAACGLGLPTGLSFDEADDDRLDDFAGAPEVTLDDLLNYLADIEALRSDLGPREAELRRAVAEEQQAEHDLRTQKDEVLALQMQLEDRTEAQELEHAKKIAEAESALDQLRENIESEQATLKEEEASVTRRQELFRVQVEQKRKELAKIVEANDKLEEAILKRTRRWWGSNRQPRRQGVSGSSPFQDSGSSGRPPNRY